MENVVTRSLRRPISSAIAAKASILRTKQPPLSRAALNIAWHDLCSLKTRERSAPERPKDLLKMRCYRKDWAALALSMLLCAAALPSQGANGGKTNEAAMVYLPPSISLESTERSEVFARRFIEE